MKDVVTREETKNFKGDHTKRTVTDRVDGKERDEETKRKERGI